DDPRRGDPRRLPGGHRRLAGRAGCRLPRPPDRPRDDDHRPAAGAGALRIPVATIATVLRGCEGIDSESQIPDSEWMLSLINQSLRILESGIRHLESDSFTNPELRTPALAIAARDRLRPI